MTLTHPGRRMTRLIPATDHPGLRPNMSTDYSELYFGDDMHRKVSMLKQAHLHHTTASKACWACLRACKARRQPADHPGYRSCSPCGHVANEAVKSGAHLRTAPTALDASNGRANLYGFEVELQQHLLHQHDSQHLGSLEHPCAVHASTATLHHTLASKKGENRRIARGAICAKPEI